MTKSNCDICGKELNVDSIDDSGNDYYERAQGQSYFGVYCETCLSCFAKMNEFEKKTKEVALEWCQRKFGWEFPKKKERAGEVEPEMGENLPEIQEVAQGNTSLTKDELYNLRVLLDYVKNFKDRFDFRYPHDEVLDVFRAMSEQMI